MKWYGLNISKFCGITVSSVGPDVPVVDEPLFLAHLQGRDKAFAVLSKESNAEHIVLNMDINRRAFKVIENKANIERYNIAIHKTNRVFKVIQN